MNKDLYGKKWDFPQDMRDHMKVCFQKVNNADANVEGYNRNLRLQKTPSLSYPELKRIKNFFDSFTGPQTDAPFILNGENKMKILWILFYTGLDNQLALLTKLRMIPECLIWISNSKARIKI